MKCLSLFSGKQYENIDTLSSAESAQEVVKVKKQLSLRHASIADGIFSSFSINIV